MNIKYTVKKEKIVSNTIKEGKIDHSDYWCPQFDEPNNKILQWLLAIYLVIVWLPIQCFRHFIVPIRYIAFLDKSIVILIVPKIYGSKSINEARSSVIERNFGNYDVTTTIIRKWV